MTLYDLTAEDWGRLFPIKLVSYDPLWPKVFEEENARIQRSLGPAALVQIEHFGSTSVDGLTAKPIIDMIIEIHKPLLFDLQVIKGMEDIGYHYFKQEDNGSEYMIFVKGYHPNGDMDQLFHIHMCIAGNAMLEQVSFRDYLRTHQDRAKAYQELKLNLAQKFRNNRVGYRKAKTDFIQETMALWRKAQAAS